MLKSAMGGGWLAAGAGFLFTYYNSKLAEERKARIERVNQQLRDFYGPLLATVTATKSAYDAMVRQHSSENTAQGFQAAVRAAPEGEEAKAYRIWMTEVLQPLNEKAADIITEHIDLLESSRIEPQLLQLVAHVCSVRVILERWKEGVFSQYSVIPYPEQLVSYIKHEFARMKVKQAELLGFTAAGGPRAKL